MRQEGFRLVARGNKIFWVHKNLVQPDDVDCTGMDDAQFEAQVCRTVGIFHFASVPA